MCLRSDQVQVCRRTWCSLSPHRRGRAADLLPVGCECRRVMKPRTRCSPARPRVFVSSRTVCFLCVQHTHQACACVRVQSSEFPAARAGLSLRGISTCYAATGEPGRGPRCSINNNHFSTVQSTSFDLSPRVWSVFTGDKHASSLNSTNSSRVRNVGTFNRTISRTGILRCGKLNNML